jgi:hypothetical protein
LQILIGRGYVAYALNIKPGKGIVSKRLPSTENGLAKTGDNSLAIHGEVLCHIINLYQLYATKSLRRENNTNRFPFGTLKLRDYGTHSFNLIGCNLEELTSLQKPFQYSLHDEYGLREGHLKFEDGIVIVAYFNALDDGVSDTAARLGKANEPLQDRVRSLLRNMAFINQRNWEKPYLVAATWIDKGNRTND